MPKLVYTADHVVIREYPLEEGELVIGRGADCQIQLDDGAVSSRHTAISIKPSAYFENQLEIFAEDQGSTNGTYINGRRVQRHLLKHGETVKIGTHEFRLIDEHGLAAEETRILLEDED